MKKTSTQWGQCFLFFFDFKKLKTLLQILCLLKKQLPLFWGKRKFVGKLENVFGTIFHHFSIIWTIKFYKRIANSCYIFLK
jgi:hypothetical protein